MNPIAINFYDSFQAIVDMMAAAEQKGISKGDVIKLYANHSEEMAEDFNLTKEKAAKLQNIFTELQQLANSVGK
jgi:hypothetical protein